MKTIFLIGGTMGVGKTTTCRILKNRLQRSVFLDGDWCWDMNPFQVTPETKQMVMENICFLLNQYIRCSAYEYIIFCWVMHEQAIIDEICSRLDAENCRIHSLSLVCEAEELRQRLQRDVDAGMRTEDVTERSIARIPLYDGLDTEKIDVTRITPAQAADKIVEIANQRSGFRRQLETKELLLKKAAFADWKAMYRNVWSRPEAARFMSWRLTTSEEDARARMERTIEHQKSHNVWTVYEKKSGQAIGFAGVEEVRPHIFQEAGIALGPEFVGRGYGKQILECLLAYCSSLGGREFYYSARAKNEASRALALSCGFVYQYSKEKVSQKDGEPYELRVYCREIGGYGCDA